MLVIGFVVGFVAVWWLVFMPHRPKPSLEQREFEARVAHEHAKMRLSDAQRRWNQQQAWLANNPAPPQLLHSVPLPTEQLDPWLPQQYAGPVIEVHHYHHRPTEVS